MLIDEKYKIELIDLDGFKILYICSKPQRIEAKVIFDRDHISQKLIFTLMEISHEHGFGCSPPHFGGLDDPSMTFLIGTVLPTIKSLNKYLKKIKDCLTEIKVFADKFSEQLDFTRLDISMFGKVDLAGFYPEHLSALKDQHYNGSWDNFYEAMISEERNDDAELIQCCMEFEETNNKDIGLVGHKLGYMLHLFEETHTENETN